jgi:hypothetical protein
MAPAGSRDLHRREFARRSPSLEAPVALTIAHRLILAGG